jgi:hypothetical protein
MHGLAFQCMQHPACYAPQHATPHHSTAAAGFRQGSGLADGFGSVATKVTSKWWHARLVMHLQIIHGMPG